MGVKILWPCGKRQNDFNPKPVLTGALVVALVLLAIGSISLLGNWETSWRRFTLLGFNPSDRSPIEIYLRMIPMRASWDSARNFQRGFPILPADV